MKAIVVRKQGRRWRHWSSEDKTRHLMACRSSGLSARAYCATHQVPLSTFALWRREERRGRSASFARVELIPTPVTDQSLRLVVRSRKGLEVEVSGLDQSGLSAALMAVLR